MKKYILILFLIFSLFNFGYSLTYQEAKEAYYLDFIRVYDIINRFNSCKGRKFDMEFKVEDIKGNMLFLSLDVKEHNTIYFFDSVVYDGIINFNIGDYIQAIGIIEKVNPELLRIIVIK